jgi:DNA-binding NarL/FixJ family response regulator
MTIELSPSQLSVLRRAAAALSEQTGRGIARNVLVELAAERLAVTLHRGGGPALAVVHPIPGRGDVFARLTAREREVAACLAAGLSNREIARALVISVGTVKDHVHSILTKTGLRSRAAVAATWHGQPASL